LPYPNDRRKHQPEGDEVLSPEYLAMLMTASGEIRPTDPEARRRPMKDLPYGRRKDDLPRTEPERRRAED
jgi:hypothetical protein